MATYSNITPDPSKSKNFVYVSDTAPSSPFHNQLWYDTNNDTLFVYDEPNSKWVALSSGGSGNCTGSLPCGDTGVFGGGYYYDSSHHYINTIDYITISTPSDATDFGDLTVARWAPSATSNGTNDRGVFGGGDDGSSRLNTIDYITISTPSDATDFGDLTVTRHALSATSNGTNDRGVFGGGWDGSQFNTIDYITISTPSDATDFGDLTVARNTLSATSNGTNDRGVFGGGHYYDSSDHYVNTIDYITISTPSDATDFGDLTVARNWLSATSNGTNDRGVFGGGYVDSTPHQVNTIDYITISTPSDATDFGDLTVVRDGLAATSNGTNDRGVFGGGFDGSSRFNTIDYITISTPSNATDFGDLTVARSNASATSNV